MKSDHLLKLLHDKKLHTVRPFQGCSEKEITLLEQEMAIKLPASYRHYLLAVGHNSGRLFQGTDMGFSQLKELQYATKELLHENNQPILMPESSFVFSMHQGYEIRFFELRAGDNPPILEWYEGSKNGIVTIFDTFEEFLSDSIYKHAATKWLD
ncbi:SMI1/KNR4 family protein [Paenibacillus sinopodophylli]|uniref:SMI1/KNR4 family protein n=1 Tax=Paenibacillus sinopodophylli TaxID=1837342 RepID=UPI00110CD3CB|nr:SMI1/KNR4 family protein [Paenibacillus sinopodophylli]